jgi:hypothetical protein
MPKNQPINIYDPKVRARIEAEFAGDVSAFLAAQKKRIIKKTMAGEVIDWNEENDLLYQSVHGKALDNAILAAELMLVKMPSGVEIPTVHEAALAWLKKYKFNIQRITASTEKLVRKGVAEFISTPGFTRGDLEQLLQKSFTPARASTIAVTEVTRAFAEGENIVSDEYQKVGIRMVDIWNTDNDELVCTAIEHSCSELEGKKVKHGDLFYPPDSMGEGYPPRHPNCRCGITHEIDRGDDVENERRFNEIIREFGNG